MRNGNSTVTSLALCVSLLAGTVNLRDYAKGDGSDETEAIQKAFDRFNVKQPEHKGYEFREQKGVLFIPAPPKFYGISKPINITEKANLVVRCETPVGTWMGNAYFRWLGGDGGEMFFFNFCWGLRIENLSLDGNGKKVTGVQICGLGRPYPLSPDPGAYNHPGAFKFSIFDHLSVQNAGIGVKLGMDGNGADLAFNSFRDVFIDRFSEFGFVHATGNGADNTVINLSLTPGEGAKEGVRITGGQLVIMNSALGGGPVKTTGAAVGVYAGGVNIYGTWSEWRGPFLYGFAISLEYREPTRPVVMRPKPAMNGRRENGIEMPHSKTDTNPERRVAARLLSESRIQAACGHSRPAASRRHEVMATGDEYGLFSEP